MIDLSPTSLVPLREVPDLLPRRRGRKVHHSTVYRWAARGVRGVRLETTCLGGVLYTSQEALERFASRLSQTEPGSRESASSIRRRQIAQAKQRLDDAGIH